MAVDTEDPKLQYHKTTCVLCSNACGLEVRLDGDAITRVRGNKAQVSSKGYTCEKGLRVGFYQKNTARISSPMRRLPDGTYIEVDWDTAVAEIASEMLALGDRYGQDKILYYGGGTQTNHLMGLFGATLRQAFGITRRSNALAQEKTGEAWVEGHMFGAHTHGDYHHAEVSFFLGKNPWLTHGFPETRRVLNEIKADPERAMVVIDPRVSETAAIADYHIRLRPGTDAHLLAALTAILIQEGLVASEWLAENTVGYGRIAETFGDINVAAYAEICGVEESQLRDVARRLAQAGSVSVYEDLGIQMAPNSTLISYLQRILWVLVGAYGVEGGMAAHSTFVPTYSYRATGREPEAPVTGGMILNDLIACNDLPAQTLTDHPDRTRGIIVDASNPVHSLANSDSFRKMMRAMEFSLVIDVAWTETARQADWVLPASTVYEKVECSFFNFEFPDNSAAIRPPILPPAAGTLPEPEIHTRLVRAAGFLDDDALEPLHAAAAEGLDAFTEAWAAFVVDRPDQARLAPIVLSLTLGRHLPKGMAAAAGLWTTCQRVAKKYPEAVARAGFDGNPARQANALFEALIEAGADGVVFTRHLTEDAWSMLTTPDQRINLVLEPLLADTRALADGYQRITSDDFPYILVAGERRSFTANGLIRNPEWRKKDKTGVLKISVGDAATLGVVDGDPVRITTAAGSGVATVETSDEYLDGNIALPNGFGQDYASGEGGAEVLGLSTNELTSIDLKDKYAGTPWHKHVPARIEPIGARP